MWITATTCRMSGDRFRLQHLLNKSRTSNLWLWDHLPNEMAIGAKRAMRLLRYRVTNFRSVEDSGWIDADDVTALDWCQRVRQVQSPPPIVEAEACPRRRISADVGLSEDDVRRDPREPRRFRFHLGRIRHRPARPAHCPPWPAFSPEEAEVVRVDRHFDGGYIFNSGHEHARRHIEDVAAILQAATTEIGGMPALAKEETQKADLVSGLQSVALELPDAPMSRDALAALARNSAPSPRQRPRRRAASSRGSRHSPPAWTSFRPACRHRNRV